MSGFITCCGYVEVYYADNLMGSSHKVINL